MSTASTPPTSTLAIGRVPFNPFDSTPLEEKDSAVVPQVRQCRDSEVTQCPLRLEAQPQKSPDVQVRAPTVAPRLFAPVPETYAANYAAFSTGFLSPFEIQDHWDDTPILINDFNSETTPEGQFLDAVGRVSVYDHFKTRIVKGTVIDFGYPDYSQSSYRFFATYSHLMDRKNAYIRIVAYSRCGFRCESSHPMFGNLILVIPRELNDVVFPVQLRFHAMHATEICHHLDLAYHRIRLSAQNAFTPLEKVWWESGRCGICDSDL